MSLVSFSNRNRDINEIFDWYGTMQSALQSFHARLSEKIYNNDQLIIDSEKKFSNCSLDGLRIHFEIAQNELEDVVCLQLIAAVEAIFRKDYLYRIERRKKDELSRVFRSHKFKNPTRVSFEDVILNEWKRKYPAYNIIIDHYREALQYRHWLAHGQYWLHKAKKFDADSTYTVCDNIISNLPWSN